MNLIVMAVYLETNLRFARKYQLHPVIQFEKLFHLLVLNAGNGWEWDILGYNGIIIVTIMDHSLIRY